jgi:hypothetical protein
MPIQYGEVTIVKENKSLFNWIINKECLEKFIFLFEDEISDTIVDFHFKFLDTCISVLPLYFEKNNKPYQIYFKSNLDSFNQLFIDNPKYDKIESKYNCIYYCRRISFKSPDIFGLIRIKSTEQMPRFLFAYDSDEFTKEEIMYVIHYILSKP